MFEPVRAWMDHAADNELLNSAVGPGLVDFRPTRRGGPTRSTGAHRRPAQCQHASAWEQVGELLGLPHEARWHKIWDDCTEMRQLIYPPLW